VWPYEATENALYTISTQLRTAGTRHVGKGNQGVYAREEKKRIESRPAAGPSQKKSRSKERKVPSSTGQRELAAFSNVPCERRDGKEEHGTWGGGGAGIRASNGCTSKNRFDEQEQRKQTPQRESKAVCSNAGGEDLDKKYGSVKTKRAATRHYFKIREREQKLAAALKGGRHGGMKSHAKSRNENRKKTGQLFKERGSRISSRGETENGGWKGKQEAILSTICMSPARPSPIKTEERQLIQAEE